MKYKIKHHPEKCTGCEECIKACAKEHQGIPNCMLFKLGEKHYYFSCLHCKRPQCVLVCPTGALERENEVVKLEPELCIGCRNCEEVCPLGVPRFNPLTGRINKCDMCYERVKRGFLPFCVEACSEGALEIISEKEKVSQGEVK